MNMITKLREFSKVSRAEFSRRYNIPLRTLEDWESGKRTPPEYVTLLLERAVKEDIKKGGKTMFNTIILKKGEGTVSLKESVEKGATIWGYDSDPEEVKRWSDISEEDWDKTVCEAKKELDKYKCEYIKRIAVCDVIEYALEYCECDEDGEFSNGSDYDLAEELVER